MLYRFLTYWKQWEECKEGDINKLRHRFQFIYDINRNVKKELITEEPFKSLVVTENQIWKIVHCLKIWLLTFNYNV